MLPDVSLPPFYSSFTGHRVPSTDGVGDPVSQTAMLDDALGGALSSAAEAVKASIPRGIFGYPRDHARAAVYLASDDAQWITGQTLNVDGGLTAQ